MLPLFDRVAPAPIRRSATLPTKLLMDKHRRASSPRDPHSASLADEVLFFHPSARIVQFSSEQPPEYQSSPCPTDFDYPVDAIETLPWRSSTEQTVAVGPLKLEKVSGLAVFLKCGTVVRAVLKNSQCWFVDRQSTFVLRIRPFTYYRIELPNQTKEDEKLVAELETALPRVLRYEVTPCPFRRLFTVLIPEEARTPKKKKAWRPKEPEGVTVSSVAGDTTTEGGGDGDIEPDQAQTRDATDLNVPILEPDVIGTATLEDVEASTPADVSYETGLRKRSVSESVNILPDFQPIQECESESEATNHSSSGDSFHSARSPVSPLLPSPIYSDDPFSSPTLDSPLLLAPLGPSHESKNMIETALTPESSSPKSQTTAALIDDSNVPFKPQLHSTSRQDSSSSSSSSHDLEIPKLGSNAARTGRAGLDIDNGNITVIRRMRVSRNRDLSPMPPPSTLSYQRPKQEGHYLTTTILQKTCSLVLIPPLQLLLLLIEIAAQIVVGHTPRSALDYKRRSDCSQRRMVSSDGYESEDDFGIPNTTEVLQTSDPSRDASNSDLWDLD